MRFEVNPGKQCTYRERVVEIDGALSSSRVSVRDVVTGEVMDVAVGDLMPLRTKYSAGPEARFIPQAKWQQALALATAFSALPPGASLGGAEALRIAKACHLSVRSVRRRFAQHHRDPRTSSMVPRVGGRPQGVRLCAADVETVVSDSIQMHYLNRQQPSLSYLVEQVQATCRAKGLRPPSRSTIVRRVDVITAYERARRRRGAKAAKQLFAPRPGHLKADRPLAMVQIDHTRCDLMVVDEATRREVLGRPWLTVAIDVCTRALLGLVVSFDAPSAVAVALCLETVMSPKEAWLKFLGIDAPWPMYGKPEVLLLDNGPEFHGQALRRGCEDYGTSLQYRPVKQPHYGAHIERLNGTLMRRLHLVPGTTFSNTRERGDYPSAKRAVMTLRECRAWLIDQVTHWYHARGHAGLGGRTPLQAWEAGWRRGDAQEVPPVVASADELRAAFLPAVWRRVQRTGIEVYGLRYWHEALAPLIESEDPVCVRHDPRDVRYVLVRGVDGMLLTVPVVTPDVPPISLAEHRDLRRLTRLAGQDQEQVAIRDEGTRRAHHGIATAAQRTRAARRSKIKAEQRSVDGVVATPVSDVDLVWDEAGAIVTPAPFDIEVPQAELWDRSTGSSP